MIYSCPCGRTYPVKTEREARPAWTCGGCFIRQHGQDWWKKYLLPHENPAEHLAHRE